ncbi:MAG: J domain-containing protein [Alphaproteobacteria bacterium]|nr:J domain-containing protein [Alphaproteobacteria bacterium]
MPKIFLKPKSPEYDEGHTHTQRQHCDMPGCRVIGEYRAPKDRSLKDYYRFCLDHVREYNAAWNFFAGMSDTEMQDAAVNSLYGDRPTWRYDMDGMADALRRKAWQTYHFTDQEPPRANTGRKIEEKTPEADALVILGLEPPVTLDDIKLRYKMLVKQHHPDLNAGCKESEELLKSVNMAYTILKIAYQKFEQLPEL